MRSRALAALLLVLALGAGMLLWSRRPEVQPIEARAPRSEPVEPGTPTSAASSGSEREAAASAPVMKAVAETKPTGSAAITVELVAGGRPANCGRVELELRGEWRRWWADVDSATGCARFENFAPGTYLISLPKTPPGFLPPRGFQRNSRADEEARSVTLAGEDLRVRFELEPAVHVFGYVRAPGGELAKSVRLPWDDRASTISVGCWRTSESWVESAGKPEFYVFDGRYEGDLYEGLWVLAVQGSPALDEAGTPEKCADPAPALRLLPPASITQIDFEFRPLGSARLRGRILDEQGQPFEGLRGGVGEVGPLVDPTSQEILIRTWPVGGDYWHIQTGADGGFDCDHLTPGRYMLFVEPEDFNPAAPPGGSKLGELPPTRTLDLIAGDNTIELSIHRAHPVHITGRVLVDDRWVGEHAQKGAQPTLTLVCEHGIDGVHGRRDDLSLAGRERSFDTWLDAAMKNPRLELELAGEKLVVPLALAPEAELAPLTIRFPR